MRERAELLAAMLAAMGAAVKVRAAATPQALNAAALYRTTTPTFAADPARLAALSGSPAGAALAGLSGPPSDVDPSSVVGALLAAMPPDKAVVRSAFDGLGPVVPLVEYAAGGVTRWAFALGDLDEVAVAPLSLRGEVGPANYQSVSARLLGLFAQLPGTPGAPTTLVELVSGRWTADQLAGTRLGIAFPPPGDPALSVGAPVESLPVRVPTFTLQPRSQPESSGFRLWQPPVAASARSDFSGNPFSLSGARFSAPATPGGAPVGPYGSLLLLEEAAHQAARAKVATLRPLAQGGAFPEIAVSVAALDAAGAPVWGLDVADFAVADGLFPQGLTLLSNAPAGALRVLIAYDCSSSVADSWPTPAAEAAFQDELAGALVSSAAATGFQAGIAALGSRPSAYGTLDAAAIHASLAGCSSNSDVWAALGDIAVSEGLSAVVVVSDFDSTDTPERIPALQARLAASGLSVGLVPVGKVAQATVDAVVRLSGAALLDPTAAGFGAALGSFLSGTVSRVREAGYHLRYRLPPEQQSDQGTRHAKVSLAARTTLLADAAYTVPALADRSAAGIGGLYLELTLAGATVTRRLTGPAIDRYGAVAVAPGPDDFAATRSLLNGLTTIAFEPGSPTTGANLDDFLSGLLSLEPVSKVIGKPHKEAVAAASAFRPYAGSLAGLVEPLVRYGAGPRVAPKGLRVVVMTELIGPHGLERRIDVVPALNLSVAATTDAGLAFRATLASTVALSLRERVVSSTSAAGNLAGARFQYIAPYAAIGALDGFSAADLQAWSPVLEQYNGWHRLVPTTPAPGALWVLDPDTGSAVAVFLDGTGGGADCAKSLANAGVQSALALLAFYYAVKSFSCGEPGAAEFACLGAFVGSVGAGVSALLAATVLDEASFLDVLALVVGVIAAPFPPIFGGLVTAAAIALAIKEATDSVNQHC
jgi:hypothetical protein